jgi:hypothetical protein
VFASLLDADKGGYCRIAPATSDYTSKQLYFPDTAMLITRFLTEDGVGEVTDFMPVAGHQATGRHRLVRQIKTVRGAMTFVMDIKPRFNYGRAPHQLDITENGFVFHTADGLELTVNPVGEREASLGDQGLGIERIGDDIRVTRTLREGETAGVMLESMGGRPHRVSPAELQHLTDDTSGFWRNWVHQSPIPLRRSPAPCGQQHNVGGLAGFSSSRSLVLSLACRQLAWTPRGQARPDAEPPAGIAPPTRRRPW